MKARRILFTDIRQNGRTVLSVDGATTTQERFAERFGSKDLILSLLNPLYFAEVLGGDGRKLIERIFLPYRTKPY